MSRKSFWSCRSGNVGIVFALAIVPMLASIGMAIDYGRAVAKKTELQAAVDSAALSLAHGDSTLNAAQLKARAKQLLAANYPGLPPFRTRTYPLNGDVISSLFTSRPTSTRHSCGW